jgi:hypothetical protein
MRRRQIRYSPRLGAMICTRIAQGWTLGELERARGMPSGRSMRTWLRRHEDFARMYNAATDQRQHDELRESLMDLQLRRPRSVYSGAVARRICDRLAEGYSMTELARARDLPHPSTIYRWIHKSEEFRAMYAVACELRAERLADEIMRIAEEPTDGEPFDKAEGPARGALDWAKLRIDAHKWRAASLAPRKFGLRGPKADEPEATAMTHEEALLALE